MPGGGTQLDKDIETALLYDFYGQLLTARQQEAMSLYHEENYSLAEIAEEFSISRQGVHDTLKNAEKALHGYESKLGLAKKFEKTRQVIEKTEETIDRLIKANGENRELTETLGAIKNAIENID